MNKQEIEKALSWVKEVINHQVFERATYEDTYGTGDLSEEELKEVYEEMDNNINLFKTIQCALTQQLNNGWIPVSSGNLPKCEERVFICAYRKCYGGKVMQIRTTGMYEDGTMHTEDSSYFWEDHDFEYCEETDDYIIPEGWFEQNMYCEEYGIIDDVVTHWMPLPKAPKEESDAERN